METRIVNIEEYWPLIVKKTAEFGQIAVAENPEFNKLAECIYRVLKDSFIETATEYGVKRWETMLNLTPAAGATLDDRKATILTFLNLKLPYTWRVLKQMLVPVLGGEDKFVMEYVNDMGKLVLHTDRVEDDVLAAISAMLERVLPQNIEVERYNHHIEISPKDINKYNACTTIDEILEVNPDAGSDLTSDGEWVYPLDSMKYINSSNPANNPFRQESKIVKFAVPLPNASSMREAFRDNNSMKHLELYIPKAFDCAMMLSGMGALEYLDLYAPNAELSIYLQGGAAMEYAKIYAPKTGNINLNTPNLKKIDAVIPLVKGLVNIRGQIDKESALGILRQFAETSASEQRAGSIGIHVDHKTDDEVLEAIANAEAKGWTLTVQWNGTPTSGISTQDLEDIYAKVTESEYGEYTDENGNRCTLEWGHYVTNSSEYKLFYSLVEAEQYYKLTRIENNE